MLFDWTTRPKQGVERTAVERAVRGGLPGAAAGAPPLRRHPAPRGNQA